MPQLMRTSNPALSGSGTANATSGGSASTPTPPPSTQTSPAPGGVPVSTTHGSLNATVADFTPSSSTNNSANVAALNALAAKASTSCQTVLKCRTS